jgi:hypothetical protein
MVLEVNVVTTRDQVAHESRCGVNLTGIAGGPHSAALNYKLRRAPRLNVSHFVKYSRESLKSKIVCK